MKGKHHIVIESARLKYEFDIRRNITIIRGDSATGKTTLIDLLQAYSAQGIKSGIQVTSDVPCVVYSGDQFSWKAVFKSYHNSIVFVDENYDFIAGTDFAATIQHTDNYYVLITRRELTSLPYSINEIYGIRTSGKYHFPQQIYHEFYRIYTEEYKDKIRHAVLMTEDGNSGFQFFSKAYGADNCVSAGGNGNVYQRILDMKGNRPLVVIADGAAFGAFIEKVLTAARIRQKTLLYFPESFEWMILRAGVVQSKNIQDILSAPEDYIESSMYFSWERFFTELLKKETSEKTYSRYRKSSLPDFYMSKGNMEKILSVLPREIRDAMRK